MDTVHSSHNNWSCLYTGCPGRNVPDFGRMFLKLKYTDITQRMFLKLKYTDITQNTYIQS